MPNQYNAEGSRVRRGCKGGQVHGAQIRAKMAMKIITATSKPPTKMVG